MTFEERVAQFKAKEAARRQRIAQVKARRRKRAEQIYSHEYHMFIRKERRNPQNARDFSHQEEFPIFNDELRRISRMIGWQRGRTAKQKGAQ